jgi:hypothetical protein
LIANQNRAVTAIINYLIKYQNNYLSSFLFTKNLPQIISRGIAVSPLLNSQVFFFTFDYDEWPSTHTNRDSIIRPYNHSIFSIRQHYLTTFPEASFERPEEGQDRIDTSKIFKINYTCNLLPYICSHLELKPDKFGKMTETWVNDSYDVLDILSNCSEWSVFKTKAVKDLIRFKWD